MIVFRKKPRTNFSSCFSFIFKRQPKVDFLIGIRGRVRTSPFPSKMLQFSHSVDIVFDKCKITSKKKRIFMHSLVDSMLNTCFNENQENLPCIFHYDAKSHPNLRLVYHMKSKSDGHVSGSHNTMISWIGYNPCLKF